MDTTKGIDSLLSQLRSAREAAATQLQPRVSVAKTQTTSFTTVLKSSLQQVNAMQNDATARAQAFEIGAPNATLHDAMIAHQKANISFQTMIQVRNKLVSAYQDIMNMPV